MQSNHSTVLTKETTRPTTYQRRKPPVAHPYCGMELLDPYELAGATELPGTADHTPSEAVTAIAARRSPADSGGSIVTPIPPGVGRVSVADDGKRHRFGTIRQMALAPRVMALLRRFGTDNPIEVLCGAIAAVLFVAVSERVPIIPVIAAVSFALYIMSNYIDKQVQQRYRQGGAE